MFTRSDLENNAAPLRKGEFLKKIYQSQEECGMEDLSRIGRRAETLLVTSYENVPNLEEDYQTADEVVAES